MAWIDPRAQEYLRRRFTRADAYRLAPPGTPEAKMPGWIDPSATRVRLKEAQEEEARARAAAEQEEFEREVRDMCTLVGHLKSYVTLRRAAQRSTSLWPQADRALERFNLAYARYFGEDKAGFNPSQSRAPKGDPDGGQWAKDGGGDSSRTDGLVSAPAAMRRSEQATDLSSARRSGHHYLPQGVYKNRRLSDETRQVFEEAMTGPLQNKRLNTFSREHRDYNEAVDRLFDQFLKKKGLTEEQMTPDHARQLLGEVITSRDSRIQRFNQRIWMRQIFQGGRFRGNE